MQDAEVELNSIPKGEEGRLPPPRRCHRGAPQDGDAKDGETLTCIWASSSSSPQGRAGRCHRAQ